MITHDLVQRGVGFDQAYAVARTIRDRLSDRDEVSTSELRDLIQEQLEKIYGEDLPQSLRGPARPTSDILVLYHDQEQPFSRGLLAASVEAAAVDLDRAYRLVTELETQLRSEHITRLPSSEIVRRVAELLEQLEGNDAARRYRLIRKIHRLSRPLVIYMGGATGTGKSSLSLELAPLLHIHRVNSTDTIRQVMRMVFTPSILPALHASSFEAAEPSGLGATGEWSSSLHDPEFTQRLIDTFEEQATRVCVGVRAVVERALAENLSVLVEGVHLHPGLVPFADLDGLAYQVPLFLATLNEEAHRARFLTRARTSRRAERYLKNFDAIRFLHDYLLQRIEANEQPLLDTSPTGPPVNRALRVVTGILESQVPFLASSKQDDSQAASPLLLIFIDGLADRPVNSLGGRTPLQAANTPNFDLLAREGQCGIADPIAPGVVADTAAGSLALFGQSPLSLNRGPLEAIGAGFSLAPGDVALRGNLATLDADGTIIDRRAGRIRDGTDELAKAIDQLVLPGLSPEVTVHVRPATEHRLAIVLKGKGLSSSIQGSDPGEDIPNSTSVTPSPLDPADEQAAFTANALAVFEKAARKVLAKHPVNQDRVARGLPPANGLLTRGAGRIHQLLPLEQEGVPLRISCIGRERAVLGVARWLGASIETNPAMTANLDTDLDAKFTAAANALVHNDLVLLHLKGADIAAHDCRPDLKVDFLERVDEHLGQLLANLDVPFRIAIASDHATLSESGQHSADPVPVLIWGKGIEADDVDRYDEQAAIKGRLERFPLQQLLGQLFHLS